MKREWEFDYSGKTARAERERTLSEKIYRLSRDLNDPQLSARQRLLLRNELQATLESLEALGRSGSKKSEKSRASEQ